MSKSASGLFESREEALIAFEKIKSEWWALYQTTRGGKTDDVATFMSIHDEMRAMKEVILADYGKVNPRHPECEQCVNNSVFGGPGHEASSGCRSGRRPHCTCVISVGRRKNR